MEKLLIEFMYNNKKRNVCLNDEKIIFDDKILYIQGLELDNKSGLRLFKKYIKKNMTDIKLILPKHLIEKFNNKFNLNRIIDDKSESKVESDTIILFKYKKSNPEKIRKFKVEKEDNQKYYGYEIDGSNKIYKTFNKDFVEFVPITDQITEKNCNELPITDRINEYKKNGKRMITENEKTEDDEEVVRSLKKMTIEQRVGEKVSGGYINDSFTVENKSGSYIIQKILKRKKTIHLKISEKHVSEIEIEEYNNYL